MANLAVRTISLIAAYALALHALLLALTPPAVLAGPASMTPAVICTSGGNSDQPNSQDRTPRAPDCTMIGCGMGGWLAHSAMVIAKITPTHSQQSLPFNDQTIVRNSYEGPQAPRAPPRA